MSSGASPVTASEPDVREQTARLLRRVSRELREPQTGDWLSLDLTMAQLKLLFYTSSHGPATVGQLAAALNVSLPSVSGTIDRLVRQGLFERLDDPTDRRVVVNRVTEAGAALVERLRDGRRARLNQALDRLTGDDLLALNQSLRLLAGALDLAIPENRTAPNAPEVAEPKEAVPAV